MSNLQFENTSRVLQEKRVYHPDATTVENAAITAYMRQKGFSSYDELHRWSVEHNEEFWAEQARELHWFAPWTKVLDWNYPYAKWFVGARTNICYNALDRHKGTPTWNKVAYYFEGERGDTRTLSYAQVYREVNRLAGALKSLGIKKGDRVTIYLPRIPEQIIAMLAVARLGAVHSVVFSGFSAQALRDRIQDGQSKLVITADGYYYRNKVVDLKSIVDEAVVQCPTVQKVLVCERAGNHVNWSDERDVKWSEIMNRPYAEVPCEEVDSEDMLYILYTSGSTGRPKGVVHVHGGYAVGAYTTCKFTFDLKPTDVFYCTADPGWVTGHTYIVYGPMMLGATQVFYEGAPTVPDPGRTWALVEKYGVTILYTAPTAIRGLMRFGEEYPARYNLSSLRLLGSVGEPINPEAWQWYRKVAGEHPVMDTWWQTETGVHMITPNPATPLKPGSATRPFLGIDADVVDKQGRSVAVNAGGFLVIRKPWPSMLRTCFNDDARYQVYWNTMQGVYFAGDAAYKDEDGYFWIQGRVDDVIKKSGHRLGSSEIESALVAHPAVAEAAVIGKPNEVTGESIKAFVILKAGFHASDALYEELRQHVRHEVGPIASPDEIAFVTALPKTRSGKIMRRLLKAQELGLDTGDTSTLDE
jgi:acetyl-CoA synthetase